MRISDWSSDVCSSDLACGLRFPWYGGESARSPVSRRLCNTGRPLPGPCACPRLGLDPRPERASFGADREARTRVQPATGAGRTLGLSSADLKGEVSLVNVFASWCTACRYEHPVFMKLKEDGVVPIHGINHRDRPQDAAKWLDDLGDPYTRTGADLNGRVSIEWGVYGVPETFVIDREGRIVFKQVGPVTPEVYRDKIGPLIEELRR